LWLSPDFTWLDIKLKIHSFHTQTCLDYKSTIKIKVLLFLWPAYSQCKCENFVWIFFPYDHHMVTCIFFKFMFYGKTHQKISETKNKPHFWNLLSFCLFFDRSHVFFVKFIIFLKKNHVLRQNMCKIFRSKKQT
jgi:hypothetical protein